MPFFNLSFTWDTSAGVVSFKGIVSAATEQEVRDLILLADGFISEDLVITLVDGAIDRDVVNCAQLTKEIAAIQAQLIPLKHNNDELYSHYHELQVQAAKANTTAREAFERYRTVYDQYEALKERRQKLVDTAYDSFI